MSLIQPLRGKVQNECNDAIDFISEIGVKGKNVSILLEQLDSSVPNIGLCMSIAGVIDITDEEYSDLHAYLESIRGMMDDLRLAEKHELQLLQQEAKASSGLPSRVLSH